MITSNSAEKERVRAKHYYHASMLDPEYRARRNARKRENNRRATEDPAHREKVRIQNAESARRRMLDPAYCEKERTRKAARSQEVIQRANDRRNGRRRILRLAGVPREGSIEANRKANEQRRRRKQSAEYRSDPQRRLRDALSTRMRKALRAATKGERILGSKIQYVGCTVAQLMRFLELKFAPGMSWDNHGTYWHIDHIKPLASFDLTNEDERYEACGYQNLQSLPVFDNISKGARHYPEYTQLLLLI
jgi:hypothetical protein